jgi:hypothetical protein
MHVGAAEDVLRMLQLEHFQMLRKSEFSDQQLTVQPLAPRCSLQHASRCPTPF